MKLLLSRIKTAEALEIEVGLPKGSVELITYPDGSVEINTPGNLTTTQQNKLSAALGLPIIGRG